MSSGSRVPLRTLTALGLLTALLFSALVARPTAARASDTQLSIMMDDDVLLYRSDTARADALKRMKALGVDVVRVTVLWSVVAQDAQKTAAAKKNFKKYGADNPAAYPKQNWDRYDRMARACKVVQVQCYFDVTGPGPAWGHETPPAKYKADAKWWKPKPTEFAKFVKAIGKRYSGKYVDPRAKREGIPEVRIWSLWNEPNQGGWLRPQWLNGKPASPAIYRSLYLAGYAALKATGHSIKTDVVLAGETAPRNVDRKTTTSAMGPRRFISELLCGPGTSKAGCSEFDKKGPIVASAWAHHPYTKDLPPTQKDPDPNVISLADLPDLGTLLDDLSATGNIRKGMPYLSTEFGYETNPPDPNIATTPDQQAQYLQQAELLTYLDPRLLANTQFLLRDVPPLKQYPKGSAKYWSTYQSGLYYADDSPKPAALAYTMPFLAYDGPVDAAGQATATVFGDLRFRPDTVSAMNPDSVQIQFKPADGSTDWVNLGTPLMVTNIKGYFVQQITVPAEGQLRAQWTSATDAPFQVDSLPQPVAKGYVPPPPPPPPPTMTGPSGPSGPSGTSGTSGR